MLKEYESIAWSAGEELKAWLGLDSTHGSLPVPAERFVRGARTALPDLRGNTSPEGASGQGRSSLGMDSQNNLPSVVLLITCSAAQISFPSPSPTCSFPLQPGTAAFREGTIVHGQEEGSGGGLR